MNTRHPSRDARFDFRPLLRQVVAGLALAATACSSNGDSAAGPSALPPSPLSPMPEADATSMPPEVANTPTPSAPTGDATPAPSPSEGQQPTALTMPPAAAPGAASSTPPAPAMSGELEPGAESTPQGPLPAVPSAGCGRARTLQDGTQTIASGGMDRTYFLETPEAYDNTYPYRVVFMFHWNYGSINAIVNPPDADRNTDRPFYGFGDLTDGKTIFVVPQGLVNTGGGAGWANPNSRDVNFTDAMLDAISADLCIDTSRVFTTGFSYGAGMSLALACVRPDKFRAAVVYEPAFISGVNAAQCTRPIAFFQSHGVDDQVLNYQTGLNVLSTFTALNGCTALVPPDPPANGHTCFSYEGCSVPTRFCNFGAGENNPFNASLRGHYPTAKDPGQNASWVPPEAWAFINQF